MQESNQFIHKMEYQKSLNQNYLVYKNECEEENYEVRMLTENHIGHLLPMELRSIDGRDDIYYKIESFQTLSKLYRNREMKLADVRMILIGLTGAIAAIQEYMLDERHVVLLPDYIFVHMESREVRLLFHPFYEEDVREGMREFADYLIGRIDHTEQQAVMMGYQFYRIVREDNFIIEDIVKLYRMEQSVSIDHSEEVRQGKESEMAGYLSQYEFATEDRCSIKNSNTINDNDKYITYDKCDNENKKSNKNEKSYKNGKGNKNERDNENKRNCKSKWDNENNIKLDQGAESNLKNLKKLFIFSVLAVMSGVFLCFGIGPYRPDRMAKVILAMILLVSVLGVGKEIMRHFRTSKEQDFEENKYDKIFSEYEKEMDHDIVENKQENSRMELTGNYTGMELAENNFRMELNEKNIGIAAAEHNMDFDGCGQEEPVIYGKTVLLSANNKLAENVLVEKKRGKEIVHRIDGFPCIIGKMKETANLVLNDVSVSRIHAKLTEEDGQVYVQDCDSTNGTFVNDVLLEKEERIPIEADDEIKIGRIVLLYQ